MAPLPTLHPKPHRLLPFFPALAAGLLLTLSFPDPGLSALAFAALSPLLVSTAPMTAGQAFKAGFVTGISHFLTLIYWLVPTLCIFGGLHWSLSVSTLVLLCLYLSLYPAAFAWLMKKMNLPAAAMPLAAAATWTGLEFMRTHLFTGFPWGVMGYSQYNVPALVQMADLFGVLGISFLLVLCNACLAMVVMQVKAWRTGQAGPGKVPVLMNLALALALLAGSYGYGTYRIPVVRGLMNRAEMPTLAIVQGNIRQDMKWSETFKQATIDKYGTLSLEAARSKPALIIWPETALPFYYGYDGPRSGQVDAYIRKAGTHFLLGSPAVDIDTRPVRYYNRVYLLDRLALVKAFYDKTRLVPFGEYVPLQELLFFIEKITEEAGNFSPGEGAFTPLAFDSHKTGVLICFEILFPRIAARFVKNGADFLVTVTNDAWFGKTSAARQHFSIAVLRAVENRRSLARAANTGISGFIDPLGRISQATPLFKDAVISAPMPALKTLTVYTRTGDLLAVVCLIAMGAVFMVKGLQNFKATLPARRRD